MADDLSPKIHGGGILSDLMPRAWTPESSGVGFLMGPAFSGLTRYQSRQDVVAGVAVPPVLPAGIMPLTADQLRAIMPDAKTLEIESAQMPLAIAMAGHGITLPMQQAAFLGQIAAEGGLRGKTENLRDYDATRLMQVFNNQRRTVFPSFEDARLYAGDEQKTANYVYNGRNGNIPDTDDGWRYRGRGPMQVTGRGNYRDVGFEDNPEALDTPYGGAQASAAWWINNGLPARTASELNRQQFDRITNTVNSGVDEPSRALRWQTYRRAVDILGQ